MIPSGSRKSLVISSKGQSVRAQGHVMGEYQYDESIKSFKQRSTIQNDKSSYLYPFSKHMWIVGPIVGSSMGSIYSTYTNDAVISSLSSVSWRFKQFSNAFKLDNNIQVEFGKLAACSRIQVNLFDDVARLMTWIQGTYYRTSDWKYGQPVYEKETTGEYFTRI